VDHLVDLISLAKRQEQVYKIGHPTPIQLGNTKARRLLQHIRDESHRFAVTFQRLKRQKRVENSILLKIPGIGQKRLNKLYQHFKSLDKMKESSIADLAKVGNISPKLATQIMDILTNV
jgi:excinuclease ABC subunit C